MRRAVAGLRRYLDYHTFKSAINGYLYKELGGDRRPVFHDIGEVCADLHALTEGYRDIQAEFDSVSSLDLRPYHEIDPGEAEISAGGDPDRQWNVFMLQVLGHRIEENLIRCPRTSRLLEGIPDLVQAFFSILEPRKSVPLHEGPYLGYLRYHLGLRVSEVNAPTLVVAGQAYTWREGEATLFDDSWPHEVINDCDAPRAVLIVDVLRPLRGVPRTVNRLVTNMVARHTYGRMVAGRARRAARGHGS